MRPDDRMDDTTPEGEPRHRKMKGGDRRLG